MNKISESKSIKEDDELYKYIDHINQNLKSQLEQIIIPSTNIK